MPSPIGHALGGLAIAWAADLLPPRQVHGRSDQPPLKLRRSAEASAKAEGLHYEYLCIALAVLPDADLLLPIAHRTVTHSVAAVVSIALLMIVAGAVTGQVKPKVVVACVAAYASHLLLDWMQADPTPPFGILLLWPFSPAWFISGWEIFRATERRHVLEAATIGRNLAAGLQEIVIMTPVAGAAWLARARGVTHTIRNN